MNPPQSFFGMLPFFRFVLSLAKRREKKGARFISTFETRKI